MIPVVVRGVYFHTLQWFAYLAGLWSGVRFSLWRGGGAVGRAVCCISCAEFPSSRMQVVDEGEVLLALSREAQGVMGRVREFHKVDNDTFLDVC